MKQVEVNEIVSIVNSVMEDVEITRDNLDDNLIELGMDSIDFIQVIVSLEVKFSCEIPAAKLSLLELNTINKLVAMLQNL